jgi:hypothetical protein
LPDGDAGFCEGSGSTMYSVEDSGAAGEDAEGLAEMGGSGWNEADDGDA